MSSKQAIYSESTRCDRTRRRRGAERPSDSRLSIQRFETLTGVSPRPWREALRDAIRERVPS